FEPAWERMVVDSDDETRIERAMERGMDRQDVLRRMNRQPQRGEWLEAADIVIPNHGTLDDLENAVSVLVEMVF
ncbi:MAG: dephospho-CoA kinase, partial [Actinobacteria bacterium]